MTKLAEIESAAFALPSDEKEELYRFLADDLRAKRNPPPRGWAATLGGITDETFVRPPQPHLDPAPRLN
jgi:hypothetical protein